MSTTLQRQREAEIARLEAAGLLDPNCLTCQREFYPHYRERWTPGGFGPFAPSHKALSSCRSGGYPHCTCDSCF